MKHWGKKKAWSNQNVSNVGNVYLWIRKLKIINLIFNPQLEVDVIACRASHDQCSELKKYFRNKLKPTLCAVLNVSNILLFTGTNPHCLSVPIHNKQHNKLLHTKNSFIVVAHLYDYCSQTTCLELYLRPTSFMKRFKFSLESFW